MAALRAVLAIAAKDILTWLRTPSAIAASLLPPVAFLLIIFVVAGAVGRNPVAVVVEDNGPQAQRLVSILKDSDAFRVQRATPVEATHLLDTLQVAAVITIPASFDDDYRMHRPDPVQRPDQQSEPGLHQRPAPIGARGHHALLRGPAGHPDHGRRRRIGSEAARRRPGAV